MDPSLKFRIWFGRALKLLYMAMIFGSFASLAGAQNVISSNAITGPLCQIYYAVHDGVFVLGIVLMIIGAVMYAIAHVMPGQSKGTLQGYGMGLILGGIIGVIIAVLAGPILNTISSGSFGSGNVLSYCAGTP